MNNVYLDLIKNYRKNEEAKKEDICLCYFCLRIKSEDYYEREMIDFYANDTNNVEKCSFGICEKCNVFLFDRLGVKSCIDKIKNTHDAFQLQISANNIGVQNVYNEFQKITTGEYVKNLEKISEKLKYELNGMKIKMDSIEKFLNKCQSQTEIYNKMEKIMDVLCEND